MNPIATVQRNRRLILMLILTVLGFAAGFVWGNAYGYSQGKADVMKAIEDKLNTTPPTILQSMKRMYSPVSDVAAPMR